MRVFNIVNLKVAAVAKDMVMVKVVAVASMVKENAVARDMVMVKVVAVASMVKENAVVRVMVMVKVVAAANTNMVIANQSLLVNV